MFRPTSRFVEGSWAVLSYSSRSNRCGFGHQCSVWCSTSVAAASAVVCRSESCWTDVQCWGCGWLGCQGIFCCVWLPCWCCYIALVGSQSSGGGCLGCQVVLSCCAIIVSCIACWIWDIVFCVVSCCIQRWSYCSCQAWWWHTLCISYNIQYKRKQY